MKTNYILSLLLFCLVSSSASALCVKKAKANLRMGPSSKKPLSWEVAKYMPFRKIKKRGKWYQVADLDGDTHWIHQGLVTSKFKCAVIKVNRANLRTGPGGRYKKNPNYPSAEKHESFKVLKIRKKWVQMTDDYGDKVWVSRKLVWIQ